MRFLRSWWQNNSLACLIFFVIVVDLVGFGVLIPILPFLSPALGGTIQDVALILVVYSLAAALVSPFWGRLSDRFNRRLILAVCLFGGALSHFLLALADSLWMVYVARTVAGLMAGSLPVATAFIADNSEPNRRAHAMGLIGRAFGVGLVLGPLIGGLLSRGETSFTLPCLIAGLLSSLAAFLAVTLLPRENPQRFKIAKQTDTSANVYNESLSLISLLRRSNSELFVLQFALHTCAVSSVIYLFPLWVANYLGWQASEVGLFFGLVGVVMILTQGNFLGWLSTRFGALGVLRAAATLFGLSLCAASHATSLVTMVVLGLCLFASATLCLPVLNTIASEIVSSRLRGQFFGITSSAAAIGRILGPLLASILLSQGGYTSAWLGTAAVVTLVVVWSLTLGSRYRPTKIC